jgi:hypothetical protein
LYGSKERARNKIAKLFAKLGPQNFQPAENIEENRPQFLGVN